MRWDIGGKMEIKSCKKCKNLFQYVTGRVICPHCLKREEELFIKVKDFLRAHPGATMQMISEETKVAISLIESFIRAGRLEIAPHSPIGIPCESCGSMIRTGKYCNACTAKLTNQFSELAKEFVPKQREQEERKAARMRYFDTQNNRRI